MLPAGHESRSVTLYYSVTSASIDSFLALLYDNVAITSSLSFVVYIRENGWHKDVLRYRSDFTPDESRSSNRYVLRCISIAWILLVNTYGISRSVIPSFFFQWYWSRALPLTRVPQTRSPSPALSQETCLSGQYQI